MENDIIYIFTSIENGKEFEEAKKLIQALIHIEDLWNPVNEVSFENDKINKSYNIIKHLRSFYRELIQTDRDPIQLYIGLLRYSAHTMSFQECNDWQKKLALYTSCQLAAKLGDRIKANNQLRFDYLAPIESQIALTILPGRKDRNRNLMMDIQHIKDSGFDSIVSLLSKDEYYHYGVTDLISAYQNSGLNVLELNIIDQGVPSQEDMQKITSFIHSKTQTGKKVLIHCVGGLGRSGMVAACYLSEYKKIDPKNAIEFVREIRSKRAIESRIQEDFVKNYEGI